MKKITALSLSLSAYLSAALPAFAAGPVKINPCPQRGLTGATEGATGTGFERLCGLNFGGQLVSDVITIAFIAASLIALAFLIYGGIRWITSGGDKAGVETARNTIVAALVGLVIVFLAYFIIRLIFGFFGLQFGEFVLPKIGG